MTEEMVQAMKPSLNAAFVVALCSNSINPMPTGLVLETGLGWGANTRPRRTRGDDFQAIQSVSPEHVRDAWAQVVGLEDHESPGRHSKL